MNPNPLSPQTTGGMFPPKKSNPRNAARVTVIMVVLIASFGAVLIGVPWLLYRYDHVVVSQATVKGTIAKLGSRLEGQVKQILVEPGQRVERGQILVQLEDEHLQAALQRALAELKASTNELQTERLAIDEERRRLTLEVERAGSLQRSAVAALEGTRSTSEKLDKDHVRISALMKEGIASSSDMDQIIGERGKALAEVNTANGLREAAESNYQTARVQLEALRVREARLGVLEAQIAIARARVAAAKADVSSSVIHAPEDGWVIDRIVEIGGSADVGDPIISLWIGRSWVQAWANEKDLHRFRVGSEVDVSLDAYPGQTLRGRIEVFGLLSNKELEEKPVPATLDALIRKNAMVPIRIAFDGQDLALQPGLSAVVGIKKQSGASDPEEALASHVITRRQHLTSSQFNSK
jgi:multidrug resistance efflux pump